MSIQNDKLMNLQDGQVLYNDLRDRIEDTKLNATLSTPTPVASFSDGAPYPMSMQFAIEPVQDLHGYSSPWPSGGGKNILDATQVEGTMSGLTFTLIDNPSMRLSGTFPGTTVYRFASDVLKLKPSTKYTISGGFPGIRIRVREYDAEHNLLETTTSAGTTTFTSNAQTDHADVYIVVHGLSVTTTIYPMIEEGETASTFSPYSNICPISGWTGANVSRTGKNLFDGILEEGTIDANGNNALQSDRYRTKNYIPIKQNHSYTFSIDGTIKTINCRFYDKNKVSIWAVTASTVTAPSNAYYLRFYYDSTIVGANIQLELGSTPTTYEPYTGSVYPITFPSSAGTVYGGTVTVNANGTGELVVDRETLTENDFGSAVTDVSTGGLHWVDKSGLSLITSQGGISSILPFKTGSTAWRSTTQCFDILNANTIRIYCRSISSADVKNEMQGLRIVYYLANPVTYQLTPGQVLSLLGQNNVWADTGDIKALSYVRNTVPEMIRQDTKGQIAAAVNPVESSLAIVVNGDKAPKNITSGQYVYVKNHSTLATGMYHATAAIAAGASITGNNTEPDADGAANAIRDNILLSNDSEYVAVTTNVNANSSYEAPADGLYVVQCAGTGSTVGAWFFDSNRTNVLMANMASTNVTNVIPLKKGMTIYTRNQSGTSYHIHGYIKFK